MATEDATVNESEFWQIIDDSRNESMDRSGSIAKDGLLYSAESEESLVDCLKDRIGALPVEEIKSFANEFERKKHELYRLDLWAIAYIIHSGCSDDYFDYFRNWVIAQGKDFFTKVVKEPRIVADLARPDHEYFFELFSQWLPIGLYEKRSGSKYTLLHTLNVGDHAEGDAWSEDELPRLYPDACKKFNFVGRSG